MNDDAHQSGWARIVDQIVRGDRVHRQMVTLGPTPVQLGRFGLGPGSLRMMVSKLATCRRAHPEVPLGVWRTLPAQIDKPLAIFPSARRDGSVVLLLVVADADGNPVIVVIAPDLTGGFNVVLSVYGKSAGLEWVATEMARARSEGLPVWEDNDFAASLPQPPVAEATSSSHGPIPSDGTAKPSRNILKIGKKSIDG